MNITENKHDNKSHDCGCHWPDDWQKNEPGMVIDFTRYDLPAHEPADPTAGHPTRNWSLIKRINQKHRRPDDSPVPLSALTPDEQTLIKKHYPDLF